ncbi:hypothetical protein ZHAS_00003793 [Anopheles sinensis]|uniref:Uncharacterized protein n=1 Tax=Anopheles sinensis TaxID=74873 RepID=A0A084VF53_ANOSI|nr:hypothetical protein ZHAS_00003793 [Anopheles sinensis]
MKLKCPSPLCLSSGSDDGLNRHRKRLGECDCLSVPDALAKKQRSEVYGATGIVGDVAVKKPNSTDSPSSTSSRHRSVSLLKRIGNNILLNLGPGTTAGNAGARQHNQVYRAFEEDRSPPPSYWRSQPRETVTVRAGDDEGGDHEDDSGRNDDCDELRAFSVAAGPTSNAFGDRFLYRSFHQYVYTPQPYPGSPGKYAIERKHKVKKRDLLLVQRQQRQQQQTNQELLQKPPTAESKTERKPCEPSASFREPRTGKACQIG